MSVFWFPFVHLLPYNLLSYFLNKYMPTSFCSYLSIYLSIYLSYVCTYIHTYIHVYIYIYIYIYIYCHPYKYLFVKCRLGQHTLVRIILKIREVKPRLVVLGVFLFFLGIFVSIYLVYWALLRISLCNCFSVFFWLDTAVLIDYFQAIWALLVFYFLITFFRRQLFV